MWNSIMLLKYEMKSTPSFGSMASNSSSVESKFFFLTFPSGQPPLFLRSCLLFIKLLNFLIVMFFKHMVSSDGSHMILPFPPSKCFKVIAFNFVAGFIDRKRKCLKIHNNVKKTKKICLYSTWKWIHKSFWSLAASSTCLTKVHILCFLGSICLNAECLKLHASFPPRGPAMTYNDLYNLIR